MAGILDKIKAMFAGTKDKASTGGDGLDDRTGAPGSVKGVDHTTSDNTANTVGEAAPGDGDVK